ncbi:MAG: oligopeptide/dipeptide ABC transporter, ATP-binding protein, C-terminal domain protein [halophilic archaeon J07HX5]|jgi:oligopeptide/dipeptide ABC transporter, ATP-binding protein, C-terminal domain|nr:MAG: oligopeptide/dipeptide ABC transporter, ATP-binding protein, C-terminal domain protein [halophilic archaeon J07HX5]
MTVTAGPVLSITDLQTRFATEQETVRAVDGVSLELGPQETLGIVGESGSGKSVTARSILGLVEEPGRVHPDSTVRYHDPAFVQQIAREYTDRVRWATADTADQRSADDSFVTITAGSNTGDSITVERGAVDLAGAPDSVVRSARGGEIAMVFQDALSSLNPVYTVGNQLTELLGTHQGLSGTAATEAAAELLESVGIPDPKRRLSEYPHQFSGGMRQRAVIALALACDPTVLLCDEPTTALDVTIQSQILDLFDRLQRERDLSIVFITHDMGVIAQVADTVAVMYAGEVVERAPVDRLFDQPKHPYTRGLLRSIPGLTGDVDRLPTIEGSVPTPTEPPTDCRYAPRCPKAFAECEAIHPEHVAVGASDEDQTETEAGTGTAAGAVDHTHTAACLLYPASEPVDQRVEQHVGADSSGGTNDSLEDDQ